MLVSHSLGCDGHSSDREGREHIARENGCHSWANLSGHELLVVSYRLNLVAIL